MNYSRRISQIWSLFSIPFLFHQFAFALGYLNCWSLMNPNWKQEYFKNLPSEIVIDILSRLPVQNIVNCKRVCKSWLNSIETREFVKSHLSKSVAGLVVFESAGGLNECKLFEFDEEDGGLDAEHHDLRYNLVTKFKLPFRGWMCGSANGLLFLRDPIHGPTGLYICNPVTRDYVQLHCPSQDFFHSHYHRREIYGFGISKTTGELKVVRISHGYICDQETGELVDIDKCECQVYTLGTGSWRSIEAAGSRLDYHKQSHGVLVNGNLHWLASTLEEDYPRVSCFDLETELFNTFSPPPIHLDHRVKTTNLFASGDCLGLCDSTSDDAIVIWLMKENGAERFWAKEIVISKNPDFGLECYEDGYSEFPDARYAVCPIKFFKDGDILMAWSDIFAFYFSSKTRATEKLYMFKQHSPADSIRPILHTPTFLSLKDFEMENVRSF